MKLFLMTGWTQEIPWIFMKHLFSELCETNKVPGVETSTSRESVKLWFTWFFHFFVDPQKLWTWICQNFMDPQNLVNPDDKKMWIHKNLNWTMPKKCGSTKFREHLWQKNVDPQKFELDYAQKNVDPQNFVHPYVILLWINKKKNWRFRLLWRSK